MGRNAWELKWWCIKYAIAFALKPPSYNKMGVGGDYEHLAAN